MSSNRRTIPSSRVTLATAPGHGMTHVVAWLHPDSRELWRRARAEDLDERLPSIIAAALHPDTSAHPNPTFEDARRINLHPVQQCAGSDCRRPF
jgi:hypothetical protein